MYRTMAPDCTTFVPSAITSSGSCSNMSSPPSSSATMSARSRTKTSSHSAPAAPSAKRSDSPSPR
eukprot:COSAG04_NODE_12223_length_664_cov_0.913274_2_plen_64_part_01